MSQQPAEEWDDMSQKEQNRIAWQASVLAEIRDSTRAAVQPSRSSHDLWPKFVASAD